MPSGVGEASVDPRDERAVVVSRRALTDDLAAKPYESLEPDELDQLVTRLEPLATLLLADQHS